MTLSVITMFCDGTEHLLNSWIANTQEKVTIDKEIIIVDNTTAQNLPETEGVKIVRAGGNVMQWAGRRKGVEASSGDYCFLVDCDDDVLPLKEWRWAEDVVCFNYLGKKPEIKEDMLCTEPYLCDFTASAETFFHAQWKKTFKNMVWNKFYKRSLLMQIYSHLPYFEISFLEDSLLNLFVMGYAKTVRFERGAYYRYYFGTGISTKQIYTSLEPVERLFDGVWTALNVFKNAFSEEAQNFAGLRTVEFYAGALTYALQKYESVSDKLVEDYTKLLKKYFSKEDLLTQLKRLGDKDISRKTALRAKHAINDIM